MEVKRWLKKEIKQLKSRKEKYIIGIAGTESGVGTTHFAIMLAEFLTDIRGEKTALLELNQKRDFQKIQKLIKEEEQDFFSIQEVTYFKEVKEEKLVYLFNMDYHYFILDFGKDLEQYKNEFLRCDKKMIIGSLIEWKRNSLFCFIEKYQNIFGNEDWNYFITFGQKKEIKEVSRLIKRKLWAINYVASPYCLSREIMEIFCKVI